MISVYCRTNLDLIGEKWPTELPAVPRVGDLIMSAQVWPSKFQLTLQVVRVSWECVNGCWRPELELHMNEWQRELFSKNGQGTLRAFYEWYAPKVGKSVSSFI